MNPSVETPGPKLRPVRRSLFRWGMVALLAAVVVWSWRHDRASLGTVSTDYELSRAVVQRVVDGDTLELTDGRRVRLLGVDTPETKHPDRPVERGGPEAAAWTQTFIEGRAVRLEFDRERRDRHGRWLAYVFAQDRPAGQDFLNQELVRAGWSKADLRFPLRASYKRLLREAEAEAREAKRGLWSSTLPLR